VIEATPFSEVEWTEAADHLNDPDPVKRAVAFYVRCRQSLAGRLDCFAPLSKNRTRRGRNEQTSAWLTTIEGLPAAHARLMRVAIRSRGAVEVITAEDGPRTLFYCDPPYLQSTRTARDVYGHEMSEEDHEELLSVLAKIKGRFLLSGYHSSTHDCFAKQHGWRCHEMEVANHAAGGPSKRRMVECVWCNFDAAAAARPKVGGRS
jgi:DNA adenine methylase